MSSSTNIQLSLSKIKKADPEFLGTGLIASGSLSRELDTFPDVCICENLLQSAPNQRKRINFFVSTKLCPEPAEGSPACNL
jgi:hypothetical protein